jgi:hypothetical protein
VNRIAVGPKYLRQWLQIDSRAGMLAGYEQLTAAFPVESLTVLTILLPVTMLTGAL